MVDGTRADKILSHLAAFRVSTREIIENHLFEGRAVGRELWELSTEKGLIVGHQALSFRRSYYQLTEHGASSLGVSEYWARPLGAQSIITNLSIAWFCCMGKLERYRVERETLNEQLGFYVPNANHCVERGDARFRIYRVYVPMPETSVLVIMRALKEHLAEYGENAALNRLIKKRAYGFAVLLSNPRRARALKTRIHSCKPGRTSLAAAIAFRVESVPEFIEPEQVGGRTDVQPFSEEEKSSKVDWPSTT